MKKYNENFIDIKLTSETVFVYTVRKAIQKAIDTNIHLIRRVVLDLGCGEMPYKQYLLDRNTSITKYIGVDLAHSDYHKTVKPDLIWNGSKIKLKNKTVGTVLATELFEHISNLDIVLKEIKRVLSKKGKLIFTVPFIWPLHETPYDEYRYTPYSLNRYLTKVGFKNIMIVPLGGYNASLAQMLCIWISNFRLSIHSSFLKKMFEIFEKNILYAIIKFLMKKDDGMNVNNYGENTMPTGFYGHAEK